jgi:transcription elongation factor GreA
MSEVIYITEEGLQKLKEELDQLRLVERPLLSKQIAEARDKGDLSRECGICRCKGGTGNA